MISNIATLSLRFLIPFFFFFCSVMRILYAAATESTLTQQGCAFTFPWRIAATVASVASFCLCVCASASFCVWVWENKHFHLRALTVSSHYNTHPVRNLQRIDGQLTSVNCDAFLFLYFLVINRWAQQTNRRRGGEDRSRLKLCTESK